MLASLAMMMTDKALTTEMPPTPGLLLAGGLARRMGGGDKPMRRIGGRTILERVIARLEPQCDGLILNANGDPARFSDFGLPVIPDGVADFPGPLAGILAGLDWAAANRPEVEFVLSAAADCPFLPRDLVERLHRARADQNAQLAVAASDGQSHPVIGLWSVALRDELRHALVVDGIRAVHRWTARYRLATVEWAVDELDPFFNANTVDDIAAAERLAVLDGGRSPQQGARSMTITPNLKGRIALVTGGSRGIGAAIAAVARRSRRRRRAELPGTGRRGRCGGGSNKTDRWPRHRDRRRCFARDGRRKDGR